jgi:hypothetical protein
MRTFTVALSVLMCVAAVAGEPKKLGAMPEKLLFTLSYDPARACFDVALLNRSDETLTLTVHPRQFQGRILVTQNKQDPVEYWDPSFKRVMMVGRWNTPIQTLNPRAQIAWRLPMAGLVDLSGSTLEPKLLQGAAIHATLEVGHWSVTAKGPQKAVKVPLASKPLTIPAEPK